MGVRSLQYFSAGIISILSFTSLSYAQQITLSQPLITPPGVNARNARHFPAYRIGGPAAPIAPMSPTPPNNKAHNAACFFSPDPSGWQQIQVAMAHNATQVPSVSHDPAVMGKRQGNSSSSPQRERMTAGDPSSYFVQPKNASDPAVIQIN